MLLFIQPASNKHNGLLDYQILVLVLINQLGCNPISVFVLTNPLGCLVCPLGNYSPLGGLVSLDCKQDTLLRMHLLFLRDLCAESTIIAADAIH